MRLLFVFLRLWVVDLIVVVVGVYLHEVKQELRVLPLAFLLVYLDIFLSYNKW